MRTSAQRQRGLTVVELLIILAIIATVATMLVPAVLQALANAKVKMAISDISTISFNVNQFVRDNDDLPDDLDELDRTVPRIDPWGREYVYLPSTSDRWMAERRRDRWMNPLNTDFDVYSVGPDGESRAALPPPVSHDDVIRANGGTYIGPAWKF